MSWSYSGNPADSPKDSIRFLVQDTDENDQLVTDEEIEWIVEHEGNLYKSASKIAKTIAAKFSRLADQSIGDYSISYSDLSDKYMDLADKLFDEAQKDISTKGVQVFAGGISKSDKRNRTLNADRVKPAFKRDMMDIRKIRTKAGRKK